MDQASDNIVMTMRIHAGAAACVMAVAGLVVAQPVEQAVTPVAAEKATPVVRPEAVAALAALRASEAEPTVRAAAARQLLLSGDSVGSQEINSILDGPGAEALLRVVAGQSQAPQWLFGPVTHRMERAKPAELPLVLMAVSSFRTRDAARLLGHYARFGEQEDHPAGGDLKQHDELTDTIRRAACAALRRLTGNEECGDDADKWSVWLTRIDVMDPSEEQWRWIIASTLIERTDRLESERDAAIARLLDSHRRVHLLLSADDRAAERASFLASLIGDELSAVRFLGFELVTRELGAGHQLGAVVEGAAAKLLTHRDPETRVNAALLLKQSSNESQPADAIAAALRDETDERVAEALLDAAARWPSSEVRESVLHWLSEEPSTGWSTSLGRARDAAAGACWALSRAGLLDTEGQRKALDVLRGLAAPALPPAACQFLGQIGEGEDREIVLGALRWVPGEGGTDTTVGAGDRSRGAALRLAAASTLSAFPEHLEALMIAAARDAELFPIAARATLLHDATASGYSRLRELSAVSGETKREGRLLVARRLSAVELLDAASACADATESGELYELLLSEERVMSERASRENAGAIVAGGLRVARERLDKQTPDRALAALDTIAPIAKGLDAPALRREVAHLEVVTLLQLDRLELAEAVDGGGGPMTSAWLDGLRLAVNKPFAEEIADAIEKKFGSGLTEDQKAEVERIRQAAKSGG